MSYLFFGQTSNIVVMVQTSTYLAQKLDFAIRAQGWTHNFALIVALH